MKVKSILDTDLYLFSVSYYFMKTYPEASGTLVFNDRNKTVYTKENLDKIIKELHELKELQLTSDELNWLITKVPYIPAFYWEWLYGFGFDPEKINIWLDKENHLHVMEIYQCLVFMLQKYLILLKVELFAIMMIHMFKN